MKANAYWIGVNNMPEIGEIFNGYCDGYFGRDSYGEKQVVAFGNNWIVLIENNNPIMATFIDKEERDFQVERWRKEK
jgi:hypothetical protein